ncbi:MAG: 50S ribosomal protein L18 [Campylobacterales bacterium]|jgi:large subunit ribosomal protein L18|nr:50S ribosomal protein L18 [Campylobacterales bacterium]
MSKALKLKTQRRQKAKLRIRARLSGSELRPRVTVFKSNKYFYAQAIDDVKGVTLAYADGAKLGVKPNREGVKEVAKALATALKANKTETVVFDRNGYLYHGVIAAFADALRENGISL